MFFFQPVVTDYQKKNTLKYSAKNIVPKLYFVFKIMCDIPTLSLSSKMVGITISRNSLNGKKKKIGKFFSMKFRSQIEHQVNEYTPRVFIMPCLLYYVSLYGVCFCSPGPKICPCRLSVNFLYSIFEFQHQRFKCK